MVKVSLHMFKMLHNSITVGVVDPKSQKKKIRKVSLIIVVTLTSLSSCNNRGNMKVVVKVMLKMDTRRQRRRARRRTRIKKKYKEMIMCIQWNLLMWTLEN